MVEPYFISTKTICLQYNIEITFVEELSEIGLLQLEIFEEDRYIHQDQIGDLEKMIRLHEELNLNLEAIDVVFNLLQKEIELKKEVNALKNRLRLYERE